MKLQQLNSNQSLLNSTIIDVTLHVNDNSQFANLLNNTSNKIYNSSVNSTQVRSQYHGYQCKIVWYRSGVKRMTKWMSYWVIPALRQAQVTSWGTNLNSYYQRLRIYWMLLRSTKIHWTVSYYSDKQLAILLFTGLQEQYRNQAIRYQMIEDDVRSVRITLEALIRDISKITTANSDCINPLSGG